MPSQEPVAENDLPPRSHELLPWDRWKGCENPVINGETERGARATLTLGANNNWALCTEQQTSWKILQDLKSNTTNWVHHNAGSFYRTTSKSCAIQ